MQPDVIVNVCIWLHERVSIQKKCVIHVSHHHNPALILISGPPRVGKNRIANYLANILSADHFALSDYLKQQTHRYYSLPDDLEVMNYESCKDDPHSDFGGKTPREAYIDYSEKILKPQFGQGFLGTLVTPRITRNIKCNITTIISGVGFLDEVLPLINVANPARIVHIQVRQNENFVIQISDSRYNLDLEPLGVKCLTITQPRDPSLIDETIWEIINLKSPHRINRFNINT